MLPPPPLKADSVADVQPLSTLGDSCSTAILEPERSALLQEALADSQLQAVRSQLESRGFGMNAEEAQAVQLVGGEQLLIPFGDKAHLVWTRANGQTAALGLVRQGNKTVNISAHGEERVVRFLNPEKVQKLVSKLRQQSKFQQFEGKLSQKGKRLGKVRVLFDETNKIAILGIASEGSEEKIAHQVRIKLKADKDDEPEDDAEPAIQATACGQATGEAVPTGAATMQPLAAPPGGGDFEGGYEGPQICTSQWGYDYLCFSRTPAISLSTTSLAVPQTFITQQTQASFTIWNSGGGTLSGTVTTSAPFSIVSGGSFSLSPGQPQEVVVKFSSATPGSFSKSVTISSNGGSQAVTATSVAHKVSFSPAQLDFGSGLLVLTEQCNQMGMCGLGTEKVGLPIEKVLTVKNEGTVSVTLSLSTSAPYQIVSVLPTLSPGQSGQVTLRFDPSESGNFTGNVQVGINGGQGSVSSSPLVGVAHKIELSPPQIGFGLLLLSDSPADNSPTYKEQQLTVKNQGVTTVSLTVSTSEPFSVVSGSSFTLAASESQEVTVRFDASAPGKFQESVRLAVGPLTVEIPATASVMNEQDFLQLLAELSQTQELDTIIPTNGIADVGLLGFKDLTESELQALLDLAENQDWDSLILPDQTGIAPLDMAIFWFQLVLGLFQSPGFNIIDVLHTLELLAKLPPEKFGDNYEDFRTQSSFGQFVSIMISALGRLSSSQLQMAFGGATADGAAKNIMEKVADLLRRAGEGTTDWGNMITIINSFGPVGALLIGGLSFANLSFTDPATGRQIQLLEKVVTDLNAILSNVSNKSWWRHGDRKLWQQIGRAIALLGLVKAYANNPDAHKQFAQTLNALLITANMARDNGWDIYGFRVTVCFPTSDCSGGPLGTTVVDVIAATTLSTGRQVNIFAQFFHAVTGYNETALQNLIAYVSSYATRVNSRRNDLMYLFGLDPVSAQRIAGYTPGIVIAVNQADTNQAIGVIAEGRSRCDDCFFGVVIQVDPDKEEVTDIIGIGISKEEAIEIARRMGITIGSKWSVEMIALWLMALFMK